MYNFGMVLQFILGVPAEVCGFVLLLEKGRGLSCIHSFKFSTEDL